jgi:hypothetical protein
MPRKLDPNGNPSAGIDVHYLRKFNEHPILAAAHFRPSREGRSVQPEKVDITIGKLSSLSSKSRRVGGKPKKRVMGQ